MNDQMPAGTEEPQKKNNTVMIVVAVVVVLCCCCVAIGLAWNYGDAIMQNF